MAEDVYTLLVQVGRQDGDGLPDAATGGALLCYAAGKDEKAAVDATVALMRDAGLAPPGGRILRKPGRPPGREVKRSLPRTRPLWIAHWTKTP